MNYPNRNRISVLVVLFLPAIWLLVSLACGSPTKVKTLSISEADVLDWYSEQSYFDQATAKPIEVINVEINDQTIEVYLLSEIENDGQLAGIARVKLQNDEGSLKSSIDYDESQELRISADNLNSIGQIIVNNIQGAIVSSVDAGQIQDIRWVDNGVLITIRYLP